MEESWRNDSKRREDGRTVKERAVSMLTYRYHPLPSGTIRLLQLMPHRDKCAPIECRLVDYLLLDSGKRPHPYEALSYVWGSPEKTRLVYLETGYLAITENLHVALLRLRNSTLSRIIWVDAICINQDDETERGFQVQLMAMIYAKATCVLVWLEEATGASRSSNEETVTNGDRALEEICAAAEGRSPGWVDDKSRKEIIALLDRSWFRRIWVLQEASAARQISIMTRSLEIDGFAFYSGLKTLNFYCGDLEKQRRIGSAVYLFKDANLRSKNVAPRSGNFSLDMSTLGELIDMYHNREATDSRDKVYALLGMSSDGHSAGGLSANYEISWKDLFRQFVNFAVGPKGLVETWGEEEAVAAIKIKGHIIGRVNSVRSTDGWGNTLILDVRPTSVFRLGIGARSIWHQFKWSIQITAKPIQAGDLVCILQDAPHATIIRAYKDYCAVIAIAITPNIPWGEGTKILTGDLVEFVRSKPGFQCDFLLLWDLRRPLEEPRDGADCETFLRTQAPENTCGWLEDPWDKATRLHAIGRILKGIHDELANTAFRKAIRIYEEILGKGDLQTPGLLELPSNIVNYMSDHLVLERLGLIADIISGKRDWFNIDIIYWTPDGDRMDSTSALAQKYDHRLMALVFHYWRKQITITEEVVKAAANNVLWATEMIGLLLDRRSDQVIITEEVLKVAAENKYHARTALALLFGRGNAQITITEELLKVAAGNEDSPEEVLALLIDQANGQAPITEEVLKQAANHPYYSRKLLALLVDRGNGEVVITEEVRKIPERMGSFTREHLDLIVERARREKQGLRSKVGVP
ncbi:HET domain protein [Nemania sp. FL0031]|nr:HET domain protein [Nemania sp. FL0031]